MLWGLLKSVYKMALLSYYVQPGRVHILSRDVIVIKPSLQTLLKSTDQKLSMEGIPLLESRLKVLDLLFKLGTFLVTLIEG